MQWVVMPSSRGFSQPRDATRISYVSCIGRQVIYTSAPIVLYTISPWELLNIHCHNTSFFMSYLSCSLSCIASSFSMDMGKSSFNLKSSYDHCWHPHNRIMRGIFTFFIRDSLSVTLSHIPENKKSFLSAWVLLHPHCSNALAWPSIQP